MQMAHSNPEAFNDLHPSEQYRIHHCFEQAASLMLRAEQHRQKLHSTVDAARRDGDNTGDLTGQLRTQRTDFAEAWGIASDAGCPPNQDDDEKAKHAAGNLIESPGDAPAVDAHLDSLQMKAETMLHDAATFPEMDADVAAAVEKHAPVIIGAVSGARDALEIAALQHPNGE